MLNRLQTKFSTVSRIVDIVCAILVVSYVLFDVLDLDGSDFTKFNHTQNRASIQVYLPSELEFDFSSHKLEPLGFGAISLVASSTEDVQVKRAESPQYTLLGNARDHGYRPGLARNSLPEKSPDH